MVSLPTINDSPKARATWIRRGLAFVTVGATVFFTLSMLWPLSVDTFRSLAVINGSPYSIQTLDQDLAFSLLVTCVKQEATPDKLDQLIDEVAQLTPTRSTAIEYRDVESLARSIQVGVAPHASDGSTKFILSFDGRGFDDEQYLLKLLSQRVANRLRTAHLKPDGRVAFANRNTRSGSEQLEQAIWLAQQIDSDLKEVTSRFKPNSRSSFQFASSSRSISPQPDILPAIESIETDTLQKTLEELKESTVALNAPALIMVNQVSPVTTDAQGSAPGWSALVMLVGISVIAATVVTHHFDPFANRGFESIEAISSRLGLPVVATLKQETTPAEVPTASRETAWSNLTVEIASMILLSGMIVVMGFVILDDTVRDSFFYHPYDGLTRIVQIFMGF